MEVAEILVVEMPIYKFCSIKATRCKFIKQTNVSEEVMGLELRSPSSLLGVSPLPVISILWTFSNTEINSKAKVSSISAPRV